MSTQTNRNRNRTPFRARARGGGQWTPAYLSASALYDVHLGGSTTEITDASGNGRAALAFGASTAAPTLRSYSADPYVWLTGVSGNYLTTPDSTALRAAAGNLEVLVRLISPTWGGTQQTIVSKFVSLTSGYEWHNTTANRWRFSFVPSGGGSNVDSTATAGGSVTTGWHYLRYRPNNGGGVYDVAFFEAADQADEPVSWTQVGSTITGGVAGTFAVGSQALFVGTRSGTTNLLAAGIARLIIRSGGVTIADINPADLTQTGVTDVAGNVWTMNYGTSGLVAVVKSAAANDTFGGVITDGTNDIATGPTAAIPALTASDACTLFTVTRPRATMTTNMTFFSTRNGTGAGVTLRMASATTVVADISDGSTTVTTPAVTITPGTRYVLGVVIPASGGAYCFANSTLGGTQARTGNTETGGALTVFGNSTPANFCRTSSRVPYASVPSALSVLQIANLASYYGGGV